MFPLRAGIATGQQLPGQLDVFAVNTEGILWVFWESNDGNWTNGAMPSGGNLLPGAPLVAASKSIEDNGLYFLSVNVVDNFRNINGFSVVNLGNWSGGGFNFSNIALLPGFSIADSTPVEGFGGCLFVVDDMGMLWQFSAGTPAPIPTPMTGQGFAPPGAPLAVGSQEDGNQLDVFVVDNTGTLWVFWRPTRTITGWSSVPLPYGGNLPPGASIATGIQGGNQLDVFVVDNGSNNNGIPLLHVWWVSDGGNWADGRMPNSSNLPPNGGNLPPGAPIATGMQGSNQLDVFVVDNTGQLQVWWVSDGGNWAPGPMKNGGNLPPGAPIATGLQQGGNQLDVFVVDNTGLIHVWWVSDGGNWADGWMPGS